MIPLIFLWNQPVSPVIPVKELPSALLKRLIRISKSYIPHIHLQERPFADIEHRLVVRPNLIGQLRWPQNRVLRLDSYKQQMSTFNTNRAVALWKIRFDVIHRDSDTLGIPTLISFVRETRIFTASQRGARITEM